MSDKILHIPSLDLFNNNWHTLISFLERRGFPKWSCGSDLDLRQTEDVDDLHNLVYINGNLDLQFTEVSDLGCLREVNGFLDVRTKNFKSFGELEYIRGTLYARESIENLGKIKSIEGTFNLPRVVRLKNLEPLEYVGSDLDLDGSSIEDLGNLKYVGGYLDVSRTKVESLGKLERVDGSLYLRGLKKLTSFGNLKYVGGNLYLEDSSLSKKSEEEILSTIHVGGKISR